MAAPMKLKIFILSFLHIFGVLLPAEVETATPQYEKLTKKQVFKKETKTVMKLDLYCFKGEKPFYSKIWMQPLVVLKGGEDVTMYEGVNSTDVEDKYHKAQKSWMSLLVPIIPWKQEHIYFNPFQSSCIGIVTKETYTLAFETKFFDYWLVMMTALGMFLFIFADSLSGNILFYYSTGISVGVLASFLIVLFVISRFIPKRSGAIAVFTAGSSVSLYFLQYLYRNISDVLQEYSRYIIGYFVIAGILSWAYCYWRGPVTNVRTLNLIKWSIQLLSLILIYNSIQIPVMSIVIIVSMVIIHNFPYSAVDFISRKFTRTWHKRFPPKKKRLTQDEYTREAEVETKKALAQLQEYCRSPDCNAWKTVSRLKSPSRFAQFVSGDDVGCHLTEDEIDAYESDPNPPYLETDDDQSFERYDDSVDFTLNSPR